MLISGEKVQLRAITATDFPQIVAWSKDEEVSRYFEGDYPLCLEDCPSWLQKAQSDRHNKRFAIVTKDDNEFIGDIELDHITWRSGDAELRVRIGEKTRWDQGFGTDAVRTLLTHAFLRMNLSRIYLRVYSSNLRALRCYQKAGFKKEGRIIRHTSTGDPREILLMCVLKQDFFRQQDRKQKSA